MMDSKGYKSEKYNLNCILNYYYFAACCYLLQKYFRKDMRCYTYYFESAFSIAAIILSAYGLVLGLKLVISLPSLPIRYL